MTKKCPIHKIDYDEDVCPKCLSLGASGDQFSEKQQKYSKEGTGRP